MHTDYVGTSVPDGRALMEWRRPKFFDKSGASLQYSGVGSTARSSPFGFTGSISGLPTLGADTFSGKFGF